MGAITWKRIRDIGIFLLGLAVAANEIFVEPTPRTEGLVFAAALLGIPFTLRQDERK